MPTTRLPRLLLNAKPLDGTLQVPRRPQGKPRPTLRNVISDAIKYANIDESNWIHLARDRPKWNEKIDSSKPLVSKQKANDAAPSFEEWAQSNLPTSPIKERAEAAPDCNAELSQICLRSKRLAALYKRRQ